MLHLLQPVTVNHVSISIVKLLINPFVNNLRPRLHDAGTTPASNRTGVATELGFHTFYAGVVANSCKRVVKKQKIPHRCHIEPARHRHRVNGAQETIYTTPTLSVKPKLGPVTRNIQAPNTQEAAYLTQQARASLKRSH